MLETTLERIMNR